MAINNVKNAGLYYLKPSISNKLGEKLESQTTGKVHLGKYQVNQAISMQSEYYMEKVGGALQNIGIARAFLMTAQANLGTIVTSLNALAGEATTLLNETVPSSNNQAAVNKIINTLGMMKGPISRDQEEGTIIKTLRQGGVGGALYFRTKTMSFLSLDPTLNKKAAFNHDAKVTDTPKDMVDPTATKLGDTFSGDCLSTPVVTVNGTFVPSPDGGTTPAEAHYEIEILMGSVNYTMSAPVADVKAGEVDLINKGNTDPTNGPTDKIAVTLKTVDDLEAKKADDQDQVDAAAKMLQSDLEFALRSGEWIPSHLDPANYAKTSGFTDFKLNADSNYGQGQFSVTYDGQNVIFRDPYKTLIQSYPLDYSVVKEAGERSKMAGVPIEVPVGNIGSFYVNELATGAPPKIGFQFDTLTMGYKASVIVSANDGTRTLTMPDITNPVVLWGEKIVIDPQKLQIDGEYKQQVKGMIDHASQLIRDTYQNVTNFVSVLESDEVAQNAALQSLHDLNDTVTSANAVEVASDVFDYTQQYRQLLNAMRLIASVQAHEKNAANAIANLATEGG